MATNARIKRTRHGDFRLKLPQPERAVLRSLPGRLRELLASGDAALVRLFPPGYADDPKLDAEYRELVHDDLVAHHMASLAVMEETIEADRLSEDQLASWLGALNDLRLVLGTQLDVTEDLDPQALPDDDPRAPAYALYFYLGWLQEQVVEALAQGLGD